MAAPSCANCYTGFMKTDKPTGSVSTIHGLNTYVATPPNAPKAVIVVIPDIFGWETNNSRLLADSLAQDGDYLVYLPDFMNGTAPPPGTNATMDALLAPAPLTTTLFYKPFLFVKFASAAIPFMARNRDAVIRPRVFDFHRAVRADPATAHLALGSAGYCWGGKYTIHLCQEEGIVDAGFSAHPSKMAFPDDWDKVVKPLAVAIGDVDMVIGIEDVKKIKELLEGRKDVEAEVRVYEGAKHGFAVRADPKDEGQTKSAIESQKQSLEWFGKFLNGKGEQK